jgi:hypothetical protein
LAAAILISILPSPAGRLFTAEVVAVAAGCAWTGCEAFFFEPASSQNPDPRVIDPPIEMINSERIVVRIISPSR